MLTIWVWGTTWADDNWYNWKKIGGLAEWFMAHASKACGWKPAEVQILYPPPVRYRLKNGHLVKLILSNFLITTFIGYLRKLYLLGIKAFSNVSNDCEAKYLSSPSHLNTINPKTGKIKSKKWPKSNGAHLVLKYCPNLLMFILQNNIFQNKGL